MSGRGGRRYMKAEDFDEGDVWGVMEERENPTPSPSPRSNFKPMTMMMRDHYSPASSSPRMIPKSSSSSSSSSYMNEDCCNKQFSAPLDIPDWSKIYGNTSKSKKKSMNDITPSSSSSPWVDFGSHDDDDDGHGDDDDDGDGDDGMVPPHEFLARKLARTQISSFSVCEGIGRTLKGRDLRKVRNAILTRTGFLE